MYADFMRAMGADPATKQTLPFDAANKNTSTLSISTRTTPMRSEGVDFWWLDWQQFAVHAQPAALDQPLLAERVLLSPHEPERSARPIVSAVGPGWGDHRHPIHFSGDADTGWKMLTFEVPFTSTAGNIGCFFWSHDIGGHMGGRNEESYMRWVQFGATVGGPALAFHAQGGHGSPSMDIRPASGGLDAPSASICAPNCSPTSIPAPGKAARSRCR